MAKQKKVTVDLPPPTVVPQGSATAAPARTLQQIQQEFTALCTKAGHLEYQCATYQKDIDILQEQMRNLNFEAAALQGHEMAQKAKAAQEKSKETTNA